MLQAPNFLLRVVFHQKSKKPAGPDGSGQIGVKVVDPPAFNMKAFYDLHIGRSNEEVAHVRRPLGFLAFPACLRFRRHRKSGLQSLLPEPSCLCISCRALDLDQFPRSIRRPLPSVVFFFMGEDLLFPHCSPRSDGTALLPHRTIVA
jgi:hypothetical protein